MSLLKTYLIWLASFVLSSIIGALVYICIMILTYGKVSPGGFEGLPYFIGCLILIVFLTGLFSAIFVHLLTKRKAVHEKGLATRLFTFHMVSSALALIALPFAWIYFNLPGIIMFALLPLIAWRGSTSKDQSLQWTVIFIILILAMLGFGLLEFYYIVKTDPFK